MEQGLYIYCIIPASQGNPVEEGIQIISHKDIAAVVEKMTLDEFQEETFKLKIEKEPQWLEEKVLHHNNVISKFADKTMVIPMKFGTIFKTEKTLDDMLEEKYPDFIEIISSLDGKEEWGVKVFCQIDKFKEHLIHTHPAIIDIDATMEGKPEGLIYFLKSKKELLITEESEKKMNQDATAIHEELVKLADRNCLNKLQPKEITRKNAEMILNGAYLIIKEKVDELKLKVSNLQKAYAESGLELEISGPWPPYSFADLEKK